MALSRLLGFDLCPRLKELKQRRLYVPRGMEVPAEIASVCVANVDPSLVESHWDALVHLTASVMSGHASAVAALARFGSAARGDPIYEAGVQLGRLLRTVSVSFKAVSFDLSCCHWPVNLFTCFSRLPRRVLAHMMFGDQHDRAASFALSFGTTLDLIPSICHHLQSNLWLRKCAPISRIAGKPRSMTGQHCCGDMMKGSVVPIESLKVTA